MLSWTEFARAAPDVADAVRRRFVGLDGVAIGFLATVSARGEPRLAPVCPIFCGEHLYISAGGHTPKVAELRNQPAYALHAFLGKNDEEIQVGGSAAEVLDPVERVAVHRAIPFKAFNTADPIFRLTIDRALWVHWERVGEPTTKPIRRRWKAITGAA
jgi:Pyridoxamine 5'-phosphate oxidase